MTKEEKVEILRREFPCNYILNFTRATLKQCNGKLERSMKADIRDKLCEKSKFFKYVNKDGNDLLFTHPDLDSPIKIETKFSNTFLYTEAGYLRGKINSQGKSNKPIVPRVEICNSNSCSQSKKIPENYSEIIICIEPFCISILFVEDIICYLHSKPGKLIAKRIPINLFYKLMDVNTSEDFIDLKIDFDLQNKFDSMKRDSSKEYDDLYNKNLLDYNSSSSNSKSKMKENEMKNNKIKQTETDKAYKLICDRDNFDLKTLSKLFFEIHGQEKTEKQCYNYCENLIKSNKITKEKILTKIGRKNSYSVIKQSNICVDQNIEEDMSKELTDNSARFGITLTFNNKSVRIENIDSLESLRKAALIAKESLS